MNIRPIHTVALDRAKELQIFITTIIMRMPTSIRSVTIMVSTRVIWDVTAVVKVTITGSVSMETMVVLSGPIQTRKVWKLVLTEKQTHSTFSL